MHRYAGADLRVHDRARQKRWGFAKRLGDEPSFDMRAFNDMAISDGALPMDVLE
jgi:uncharacterized protein (DUF885 family)